MFKESPPSIMATIYPNWSTKILRYEISYIKGNILSPLKLPTSGRLHCWFCLKLLKVCLCSILRLSYNITDSSVSKYSPMNIFQLWC
jgi:hypothetical protein